jgi:4-amino-4-deoxy-L-arabinose transferase-like glycosyltransferase
MRTAELAQEHPAVPAPKGPASGDRGLAWTGLGFVLLVALGLRLWGVQQGLPFVYNPDEAQHFVPHAVDMFSRGTLDPRYLANPPAFTYLVHWLLALWYGSGHAVVHALAADPKSVYTLARVASAVLGTASVWLLYATAARLFGRGAGVLAAALEAVAFLPVFYSHLALNDVATLAPLTLSLLGSVRVLQRGRMTDHVLAGAALGLACATKYTAGVAVLPLLAAVAVRWRDGGPDATRRALLGLVLAGGSALALFVIANPYSVLHWSQFRRELAHQSAQSGEAQGKLGAPRDGGLAYYLWTLTWGLGWAPALAALGGALTIWRRDARIGWMLVPAPIAFLIFMGVQGRYFGRWLLPIFPLLCLLAAYFVLWTARRVGTRGERRRARRLSLVLTAALTVLLLAQGAIYSVHSGLILARSDTRTLTRQWLLAHIPRGARIVAEPVSPDVWAREEPSGNLLWRKYPSMASRITPTGALTTRERRVTIEDYERTLAPSLLGYYLAHGYCYVITGSTQSGRAYADPAGVPLAIAYYRELARLGTVVFRATPYARGAQPPAFNFDWSFDYYPLSYDRPGPAMTVYRLHGGRCP